jgi:hypothetical protein
MSRIAPCFLVVAFLVTPVLGQPREWADDFTAVRTYDSASLFAPCSGGPSTKYSIIEVFNGDIYNERALSGGGSFIFSNRTTAISVAGIRAELVAIGILDMGQTCPDNPDPTPGASFITSEPFTSPHVCMYGGVQFTDWQLHFPNETHDVRGDDGKCGVANVDDDLDGTTDEFNECLATRPTSVNGGYGNRDGTGFRGGVDAAAGVAGVDDDANGVTDDMDELGWPGSDDGDDTTRQAYWMILDASVQTTSLIDVEIDPASPGDVFNLRHVVSAAESQLERTNEIVRGYYRAHVHYNWAFCSSGTCYGAVIWDETDMANPDETLGPVTNTNHTGASENLVGFVSNISYRGDSPSQFIRRQYTLGCTNFSNTFWVISGNPAQYYPSPSPDLDNDKDVDGFDFLTFSNCYNGSNKLPLAACSNSHADLDDDGDVDGFDFLTFSNCYNGSNRKPLAACFTPNLTTCGT